MAPKNLHIYLIIIFTLLSSNVLYASELNINIEGIDETRATEEILRRLNVTLKASGRMIENSKGVLPIKIKKAYCDQDTILKPFKGITEENIFSFSKIEADLTSQQTIYLSTPNRFNKKLFLEGEVTVYTPQTSSRIIIPEYQKITKEKVKNAILEKNGISLIIFTKSEYKEFILASQEIKSSAIEKNQNFHDNLLKKYGAELTDIIENSNSMLLGEYDIYFVISDNWKNVANIEMLNSSGETIKNMSRSLSHGTNKIICGLDYNGYLPSSGNFRIDIVQKGDTKTVPFQAETELP